MEIQVKYLLAILIILVLGFSCIWAQKPTITQAEGVTPMTHYFLACYNAPQYQKDMAHYVLEGDGHDDEDIMNYINMLHVDGGVVELSEGQAIIGNPLRPPDNGSQYRTYYLIGQGNTATRIKLADNANCNMFADTQDSEAGIIFKHLWFQGNKNNQESGNGWDLTKTSVYFYDVRIDEIKDNGICVNGYAGAHSLKGEWLWLGSTGGRGITGSSIWNWRIDHVWLSWCGGNRAISLTDMHDSSLSHIGVDCSNSTDAGVVLWECTRNEIQFDYIGDSNGNGLQISGCNGNNISIASMMNNAKGQGIWPRTNILLDWSSDNNIFFGKLEKGLGNVSSDIYFKGSNSGNRLMGTLTNGIIGDTPGNFIEVSGYVSHNSGTWTIPNGQSSVQVSHGLDITPSINDISITRTSPQFGGGEIWIESPTSTTFLVCSESSPTNSISGVWNVR